MIRSLIFLLIIILSGNSFLFAQQIFQYVSSSMGISGQTGLGHTVGWGDIDIDIDEEPINIKNNYSKQ